MTQATISAPGVAGSRHRGVLAIIFDLDGVIVDSKQVMREAFATAYREVVGEGDPPFEEYSRHLGRYFPDIMRIMDLPLAMQEPFVRESYRLSHQVSLFDGMEELLWTLRASGLRLVVATGKSGERARALLKQLGVLALFDHVIGSDEVARAKPAPDIVVRALHLLDVGPDQTFMVGDAATDIQAAHDAGVAGVAALWGEADVNDVLAQRPDAVTYQPLDLLSLLHAA